MAALLVRVEHQTGAVEDELDHVHAECRGHPRGISPSCHFNGGLDPVAVARTVAASLTSFVTSQKHAGTRAAALDRYADESAANPS